ncbi:MAG: hypothetical protein EOO06_18485 [Chitinophagaceae bacterium]|nr:MAG: hypothetical protein EOO06_18485 [Chitinophagaceae bacterium]
MQDLPMPDGKLLLDIVTMKMPFGKYKGTVLKNLPVSYLEWFQRKGFPKGRLGMMLETLYEIKINGLEDLLSKIKA